MTRLTAYLRPLLPGRDDIARLPSAWRIDLLAGLTVGIVALPLALGFGVSSGAGAEAGLITAIVAGIVAAVFGGSHVQISGPTGAMVVVLAPIVAQHGVAAVAAVSLLGGIFVLLLGLCKLGRIVSIIPWPVIEGFTLGIAVIIFLQQVPSAVGVTEWHGGAHSTNALIAAIQSLGLASWPVAAWSLLAVAATVVIMVGVGYLHRAIPASIVAILVVSLVAFAAGLPIPRIGALPASLPMPSLPPLDWAVLPSLLLPAASVAALAAIESLLSARVAAGLADTGRYEPDRELVGQGLASIAAGLFGGMPATGAIARTAVNVRSGGRTRLASIVHALVLLIVVLLASRVVAEIPLAALDGVLMVTAVRMVNRRTAGSVLRASRGDAAVFVATAIVTVAFDLIWAVIIGVVVAAILALRTLARSAQAVREPLPGPAAEGDERIALFRLDGALFFAAAESVVAAVEQIEDVEVVIVRMSQLRSLDATGARAITELVEGLERRGVTVLLKGIQAQHLALADRVGVLASLRDERHLFAELPTAVEHARSLVARRQAAPDGPGEAGRGPLSRADSPDGADAPSGA